MVMGLIGSIFRLISCVSSISRHGIVKILTAKNRHNMEDSFLKTDDLGPVPKVTEVIFLITALAQITKY